MSKRHPELGRALPRVLQTLGPVSSLSSTEEKKKSCRIILGADLALPLSCCVTVGKVFELSFFSPLNWEDKIDLTVISNVRKHWPNAHPMSRCSVHHGCCYSLLLLDCSSQPCKSAHVCPGGGCAERTLALSSLSALSTVIPNIDMKMAGCGVLMGVVVHLPKITFGGISLGEIMFHGRLPSYKIPEGWTSENVRCLVPLHRVDDKVGNT